MSPVRTVALLLALTVLAVPLIAGAQQPAKLPRLGILLLGTPATDPGLRAFQEGMRRLGYVEGRNIIVEYHYAGGQPERLPVRAAELVSLKPEVIVALGGDVARFAKSAAGTIPVVMITSSDPVASGLVGSLGRPGGHVTGVTFIASDLAGKRLQFLKEAAPAIMRIAVLWNPDHPDGEFTETQGAARTLGIQVESLEVRGPGEFDGAFQQALKSRAEAVIVVSSRLTALNQQRIIDFATKNRLLLVAGWGPWAQAGGLLSYGPDLEAMIGRAATYVDRIFKGARPAELPIEQPTRFELIVNLKTANAFGLTLPQSLLLRADQVIQ
jgi:putative tryptophan/tyrosine transport system substrate-binding protein